MFEHLDKLQALEDRYIDLEAKIQRSFRDQ